MVAKFHAPSGKNDTQQPAQTTPHTLFMTGSEFACGVRVQHPQDAVGAGCRAEEKQRNLVRVDLVFSSDVTQLRIDVPTVSERRPQHFHASLVSREGAIASPHNCCRVNFPGYSCQKVATERFESASVPNLRLAQVDFDAGISPQLTLDQVENGDSSKSSRKAQSVSPSSN